MREEKGVGGERDEARGGRREWGWVEGVAGKRDSPSCPALLFPWDWSALASPGTVAAVTPDWPPYYSLDTC